MKIYAYLALGDSYTIGEQVLLADSFPYQTVELLRAAGHAFAAPEIVATTGWTSNDLLHTIDHRNFLAAYDYISLLIGVNNQYQDKSAEAFRQDLRILLEWAIRKTNNTGRVNLLSIPDWGVTPFAENRDRKKISEQIDLFNFICQAEAEYFHVPFIDITTAQRINGSDPAFLTKDQLHPAQPEYAKWAGQLSEVMISNL